MLAVLLGAALILGLVGICYWAATDETSGKAWYRDWGG